MNIDYSAPPREVMEPPMAINSLHIKHLPDDLLQRVLAGVPLDDHLATALVCRTFRAVIDGSRFLALRQRCGFAERGIVLVGHQRDDEPGTMRIRMTDKSVAMISEGFSASFNGSTTDGGVRLFVSTIQASPRVGGVSGTSEKLTLELDFMILLMMPRIRRPTSFSCTAPDSLAPSATASAAFGKCKLCKQYLVIVGPSAMIGRFRRLTEYQ